MTKKKNDHDIDDSVPNLSDQSSGLGTIRINHSVIAGIVRLATQSVKGVVNVGGAGVVEGLTD
ncbi:MAG: Asp23/Gls24 family envelope stress response protein, partial [Opitutae bacterium]